MTEDKPICLLIDDDEDDQLIFETTIYTYFSAYSFKGIVDFDCLKRMCNGLEINKFKNVTVIFLDLNMPKNNGIEILKWIKKNPIFMDIPVMIYSTSKNPNDKLMCQELGAKGFVSKPSKIKDLVNELLLIL